MLHKLNKPLFHLTYDFLSLDFQKSKLSEIIFFKTASQEEIRDVQDTRQVILIVVKLLTVIEIIYNG